MCKPNYDFSNMGMKPIEPQKIFVPDMLNYLEALCDSSTTNDLQRHFIYMLSDMLILMPSYLFIQTECCDLMSSLEFHQVHNEINFTVQSNLRTFFLGNEK